MNGKIYCDGFSGPFFPRAGTDGRVGKYQWSITWGNIHYDTICRGRVSLTVGAISSTLLFPVIPSLSHYIDRENSTSAILESMGQSANAMLYTLLYPHTVICDTCCINRRRLKTAPVQRGKIFTTGFSVNNRLVMQEKHRQTCCKHERHR